MKLGAILILSALTAALAVEDSCVGRCEIGFDSKKKCQCDSMCKYYQSCCVDYDTACRSKVSRGDLFDVPEDEYDYSANETETVESVPPETHNQGASLLRPNAVRPRVETTPENTEYEPVTEQPELGRVTEPNPTEHTRPLQPEPAELCSGDPFDAFTQVKNGSMYAFRGQHFYELDDKEVKPGYPKLIKDVWGVEGPIDTAFTRINCQGKTYIFKGKEYWRFEDGVLDPDYPRDISEGFSGIPDNVDAAFALPAANYRGKEKVYFFKGSQYYQYEFRKQPSQQECSEMEPSTLFSRYTALQYTWEDTFSFLFQGSDSFSSPGPRLISRDWKGLPGPVDAVMAARLYVAPKTQTASSKKSSKASRKRSYKRRRERKQKHRQDRSMFWDLQDLAFLDSDEDYDMLHKCQPIQSIYFFIKDKYYRVNLQTKRVDFVSPPYPRSIAKYWLGCPEKGGAERK
ncbi:vitronectin-like [Acipenser oxyrinchus oxyrinchus]|uniref:Vitronectin-like n=1 Tax=Acipenser oxyrinchus oxyrinchus TaxID=40147 RepID=A0AAD8CWI8_ACIOX|nr:vitronectin-like [Acipenser oxyrinchus oxyrinchus]